MPPFLKKTLRYLFASLLATAGLTLCYNGYLALDPSVDGRLPGQIVADDGRSGRRADNVSGIASDSGTYIVRMGTAVGGMVGGLVLLVAAWKVRTHKKTSY